MCREQFEEVILSRGDVVRVPVLSIARWLGGVDKFGQHRRPQTRSEYAKIAHRIAVDIRARQSEELAEVLDLLDSLRSVEDRIADFLETHGPYCVCPVCEAHRAGHDATALNCDPFASFGRILSAIRRLRPHLDSDFRFTAGEDPHEWEREEQVEADAREDIRVAKARLRALKKLNRIANGQARPSRSKSPVPVPPCASCH